MLLESGQSLLRTPIAAACGASLQQEDGGAEQTDTEAGHRFVRLSFAVSLAEIEEGLARLSSWV